MKLAKVVLSFSEAGAPPTVTLAALGTEYSVVYRVKSRGLRKELETSLFPQRLENLGPDEDLPDEIECILSEGEMLMNNIGHHLSCKDHREIERSGLKIAHETLEKAKAKFPHITELTLESVIVQLSTGLSVMEALATNMVQERMVNKTPNAVEIELGERAVGAAHGGMVTPVDPAEVSDVVLDYECCSPAITEEDRAGFAKLFAKDQSHAAAMSTHPAHLH